MGLYSASYRILSQVLFAYYSDDYRYLSATRQAKQAAAPEHVAASYSARGRWYLGVVIATLITLARRPLVTISVWPGIPARDVAC